MKALLILFGIPITLALMCLYFWFGGNLTLPDTTPPTEQEYCSTQGNTNMRYLSAKCLKYFTPTTKSKEESKLNL